jgi:predicted outer membrane protein
MKSRALRAVAVLLCSGPALALIRPACKQSIVPCPGPGVTSAPPVSPEEGLGTATALCVSDTCSLATVRAMVTTELQAALLGRGHATDTAVRAVAAQMEADFREDQANLDALEEALAVAETPCPESRKAAADLGARLPAVDSAFDHAFVAGQVAALKEIKRTINTELVGCAANGNLKTALRFERMRASDGGADRGVVADLAALQALAETSGGAGTLDGAKGAAPAFLHPGILVTRAQLDFVKENIRRGAEPWASAFLRAKSDRHGALTYVPHPPLGHGATDTTPATEDGIVLCGSFSDPDVHCSDEKEDGVAAYTQALLWYLSGDERYARNAIAILNGWAILEDHRFFNAALQAGWMGTMFARAAELMQISPLWTPTEVAGFKTMMRHAFVPLLLAARPGRAPVGDASYGQNGNWVLSIADSLIALGVLLDDRHVYDSGVGLWRDRVPPYCYLSSLDGTHPRIPTGGYGGSNTGNASPPTRTGDPYGYWGQAGGTSVRALFDGVSQETCRDLEHVQFGLAALTNGAETARIQGLDLYREEPLRIAACMEFAALYEDESPTDASGRLLPYVTPVNPSVTLAARERTLCPDAGGHASVVLLNSGSLAAYAVQPTWEVGYNALANRLGLNLPHTRQLIAHYRSPPSGWVGATHHMAWETLTHGELGSVGLPR